MSLTSCWAVHRSHASSCGASRALHARWAAHYARLLHALALLGTAATLLLAITTPPASAAEDVWSTEGSSHVLKTYYGEPIKTWSAREWQTWKKEVQAVGECLGVLEHCAEKEIAGQTPLENVPRATAQAAQEGVGQARTEGIALFGKPLKALDEAGEDAGTLPSGLGSEALGNVTLGGEGFRLGAEIGGSLEQLFGIPGFNTERARKELKEKEHVDEVSCGLIEHREPWIEPFSEHHLPAGVFLECQNSFGGVQATTLESHFEKGKHCNGPFICYNGDAHIPAGFSLLTFSENWVSEIGGNATTIWQYAYETQECTVNSDATRECGPVGVPAAGLLSSEIEGANEAHGFPRRPKVSGVTLPTRPPSSLSDADLQAISENKPGRERIEAMFVNKGHEEAELAAKEGELLGASNEGEPSRSSCHLGGSVNCATGNETQTLLLLAVGGHGPKLDLSLTYNAQPASAAKASAGPYGYGWSGSFSAHTEYSSETGVRTVILDNGASVSFVKEAGEWVPISPGLTQATLAEEGEAFILTLPDQTKLHFNAAGNLASEEDRDGNKLTVTRGEGERIESVADEAGHKLSFAYGSEGMEMITDPMGHKVKLTHEGGNLATITLPGEEKPRYSFKYDAEHELTAETDGRGNTTEREYKEHKVVSETDQLKRKRTWEYFQTEHGTETKITEPNGTKTVEQFNEYGSPTSVTHDAETSLASTTTYGYNGEDELLTLTDPNKHKTEYSYDSAGNKISEKNADGDETKWKYDSTHDVETETTPEGETTTIKRNGHGDPETIERPVGSETQKTTYKYAGNGDVESMTNPLEQTWKYEYDSFGDRKAETDPEGNKRTWEYNEDSQETATVSPRGNVGGGEPAVHTTTIERDAQGRPLTLTGPPREAAYGFAFGSKGTGNGQFEFPTLEAVTPSGDIWVSDSSLDRLQEFNEKGEYQAQFGAKGTGAKEFKFPFGIAVNPSTGNIYVSDYENYRVQELSSSGAFIRMFGYGVSNGKAEFEICTEKCESGLKGTGTSGQFGRPVGVAIDASGNVWVADEVDDRLGEFKENGEFIKEFGAEGKEAGKIKQPVGLAYDNGNLYVAEAGNQRVQEFSTTGTSIRTFGSEGTGNGQFKTPYAIAAGPTSGVLYVTDRDNDRVQEFTATGHFLSSFGSRGKGTGQFELPTGIAATAGENLYVSDHDNQRVQEWTGPSPRMTKYAYDANGNLETLTDPNGNKTKYVYDADNELTKTEEPQGTATETEYDSVGQAKSQTDGNKHTTKYERNLLEEVTEVIDPKERKTTKEYDAAGNLTSMTDAAKRTTTYTYDLANRLEKVSYSDGKTHAVEYEYNKDGQPTKMTDGSGITKNTYDKLDRLTEAENGHKEVTKYTYNLANEPTQITYPNGKEVTRTYDKDARLEKVTDWNSKATKFTYNEDSELKATVFPSETKDEDTYAYNDADQMTEVKMAKSTETLASLVYAHDGDGQVTTVTSKGLPGEEKPSYEYDKNNRLTKGAGTAYEYDSANNPTKIGSGTYKYDAADELESGGGRTYSYNEVGQRTKATPETGSATTYGYDQAGNLISVEKPKEGETAAIEDTYGYNGEGLRVSQTISGATTYMDWQTNEALPLLLSDGTNSYIYGPGGMPVEQISSGGIVSYLHHDQQGSTRLLTGSAGTVTGKCTYGAYGTPTCEGTATTPLGYDGQYTSSDTGLVYLRNRVYDPATAQFLSRDPAVALTREPYAYGGDNPVNRRDPDGLSKEGVEGVPCYFPLCGPPPAATEEVLQKGAETVEHGIENVWNAVNENEEQGDEGEAELREKEAQREQECGEVTFGHGGRHLEGTDLSQEEVERAIEEQVNGTAGRGNEYGPFGGRVIVNGKTIEYRGYGFGNGNIHIGTYYPVP